MIKPDKNFNMSRASKTKIALMCKSDADRSFLKSVLIQAELSAEAARRAALKSKGSGDSKGRKDPIATTE